MFLRRFFLLSAIVVFLSTSAYSFDLRKVGNVSALDAMATTVAVWTPERFIKALKGNYQGEQDGGSQMVSGVIVNITSDAAYIISTQIPENTEIMIEFPGDRNWAHTTIDDLVESRIVREIVPLQNDLVLLVVNLNEAIIPLPIKVTAAELMDSEKNLEDVFLIFNYLGQPELILWGSMLDGYYIPGNDGMLTSFYKVGYSVFSPEGYLIGIIDRDRRVLQITPDILDF